MKRTTCLTSLCATFAVLALSSSGAAQQYRNSATGETFNNSYSAMLSVTNSMMQNFTTQQRQYIGNTARMASAYSSPSTPAQPAQAQPVVPQNRYPITATDFQGAAWREVPPRLMEAMKGGNSQDNEVLQKTYYWLLTEYEKTNRKSNIASAVAYAVNVSLEIQRGIPLSPAECAYTVQFFNNTLANNPQFYAMTPQQKQILYESSIITGGMAAVLFVQGQQQNDASLQLQGRELAQSVLRQWAGL